MDLGEFGAGTIAGSAGTTNTSEDALSYLRSVYRDPLQPTSTRLRAAGLALPFELPKLAVTAIVSNQEDFASRLDRSIERANAVRMLSAPNIIEHRSREHDPSELRPGNGQLKRRF
jgi:hypothetical protein